MLDTIGYIRAQYPYESNISVKALAGMAELNVKRYEQEFRKQCGLTPKRYVIKCRLDFAEKLMHDTEHTCSHIASLCGFLNYSYFAQLFKRVFNLTPTAYRLNVQKKQV